MEERIQKQVSIMRELGESISFDTLDSYLNDAANKNFDIEQRLCALELVSAMLKYHSAWRH